MKRARKTEKREGFLNDLIDIMRNHEVLGKDEKRTSSKERPIQKALFSRINLELPSLLEKHFYFKKDKANEMRKNFVYESSTKRTVHGFSFFATNHRPDAVLSLKDMRVAFEIKKGDKGYDIRTGIGQSIVYSFQFDFCIYFFVDTTPGGDIKNACSDNKEGYLINSLWDLHNIKFLIV